LLDEQSRYFHTKFAVPELRFSTRLGKGTTEIDLALSSCGQGAQDEHLQSLRPRRLQARASLGDAQR
jgi:hypothetical protein